MGLEDQLLAEVVKADRPDLEEQKAELTRQQGRNSIDIYIFWVQTCDKLFDSSRTVQGLRVKTKLHDWVVGQAGAGCYSRAAMSSNDW